MFRSSLARGASISALALGMALILSGPALADTDATLRGHVDGGAPGTTVVAVDTATGHKTTAVVDRNGDYTFLGLRPSTYRVEVAGRTAKEATLEVGQTVAVDFASATGVSEVVIRKARARLEVATQEVSTSVSPQEIENLPQNARNFLSFATLAPGIQLSNPSGAVQVQAGAVTPDQTNVFIDGISFKNLTNHGGAFGQNFGQGGNPFPQIAIQEYQVETANFGAETGQTGSAVINAITKTGGNEFHGSVFNDFQPQQFINKPAFQGGPKPKYNRDQYGGEISGPIIKDRLTFYFAAEGTKENLPGSTSMLGATNPAYGFPANVVSAVTGIPHSYNFSQNIYFGKLTFYATANDTVNFTALIRDETNLSDIDGNAAITHARSLHTQVDQYQLSWKHSAGNLLNVLNIAYNDSIQATPTVGSSPEYNLTNANTAVETAANQGTVDNFNTGSGAELGAHFFTQSDHQRSITFKDDLTYRLDEHKFKLGGQVILNDLSRSVVNAYNGRYYFNNPGASAGNFDPTTAIPYGAQINTLPLSQLSAKDDQIGFYAQDEWKPDNHWTVNLGLRWDYETNANNNNYVTPANIVAALAAYTNWTAAGINYKDYVSTGSNRSPQLDEFQPRFGVSYDVFGDKDLVLFAGAGRYYDRSLFIEGAIESLTNNSIIPTICFNSAVNSCGNAQQLTWNNSYRDPNALRAAVNALGLQGGSVWLLNNKTPAPYSDQYDIGVRKRFGEIQTSVTLSYQNSRNLFQYVRGNRLPNGTYTSAGLGFIEDGFPSAGQLPGFNGKLDIGESSGVAHLLALYVQARKPFTERSKWGFVTSLTIQKADTNDATPSIYDQDEFFNGGSQTAYGWGNVAGVPQWIWNTSAEYRLPYHFLLTGTLFLNSGPSFGHIDFAQTPSGVPIPSGACCYANFNGVYWPKDFIGYKRLDLRLTKSFKTPYGEAVLDIEALNVFNWLNRTYSAWGAGSGTNPSLTENGQVGNDQRQFQAGVKYKF